MSLWYVNTGDRADNPVAQRRDQLIHVCFLPIRMRDLEARKVEDFGDDMREVAIREFQKQQNLIFAKFQNILSGYLFLFMVLIL
ncbi:hypothetical protein [Tychonema sp. BBK16]|uniref:hypothetical protein n=1 Tax=Tychonema sp. BBK16 TaxID=2699888 RepID=UPI001F419C1B|nr:hypothetical protein [Tychonema sp. BBK16]MCF6372703.1 hypothetical protein [Tychonema sp. BBK16]